MRSLRITPDNGESAVYHCTCRLLHGIRLTTVDRESLRDLMWRMAEFNGVEILTYCVLRSEVHILLRLSPESEVPDEELVRRKGILYGERAAKELEQELADRSGRVEARAALLRRMHDLSCFFKELKMRFTNSYNHRHERFGTLWAERFYSLLIENKKEPLLLVATYIDLSPLRHGLCKDPGNYPFSGYGEAVAGNPMARAGIEKLVGKKTWQSAVREYEAAIYGRREIVSRPEHDDAARCLRTGIALGSADFIKKIHERYPSISSRLRPGKRAEWPEEDKPYQFARRERRQPVRRKLPPSEMD